MTADGPVLTDTRDMYWIHDAFRRSLGDGPGQIAKIDDADVERARELSDYLAEVLWLLHAHHEAEDALLYPLLQERAPEHKELFSRMDDQHAAVKSRLEAAEHAAERFGTTGSVADGQTLAKACDELREITDEHLSEEESQVLSIAGRCVTPPEWGAIPAHALSHYAGDRLWLPFGLVLEAMPDEGRESTLAHVPPPVSGMWRGGGSDTFANEMAKIRGIET